MNNVSTPKWIDDVDICKKMFWKDYAIKSIPEPIKYKLS